MKNCGPLEPDEEVVVTLVEDVCVGSASDFVASCSSQVSQHILSNQRRTYRATPTLYCRTQGFSTRNYLSNVRFFVQARVPYQIRRRLTHPSVVASKGNAISTSIQNSIEALAHAYVVTILAVCVLFGRFIKAIQSTGRYHVVALERQCSRCIGQYT